MIVTLSWVTSCTPFGWIAATNLLDAVDHRSGLAKEGRHARGRDDSLGVAPLDRGAHVDDVAGVGLNWERLAGQRGLVNLDGLRLALAVCSVESVVKWSEEERSGVWCSRVGGN